MVSLSLETGENKVSTLLKSSFSRCGKRKVLRASTSPVTRAVFSPCPSFICGARQSYRYSAVSEKAVKMMTFLLSPLMGWANLYRKSAINCCSLLSCSGVMSSSIRSSRFRFSKSSSKYFRHVIWSISSSAILVFLPPMNISDSRSS